jgi:chromosome segregation ATPase
MKQNLEVTTQLAGELAELEAKLEKLETEISEIGQPAGYELKRRFDAMRIETNALKRNIAESQGSEQQNAKRLQNIKALIRHVEREEASVEHEAHFLHQAAPSSVTLIAAAGARLLNLYRRGKRQMLGDRHPLGHSVFVNNTHDKPTTTSHSRRS